MLDTSVLVAAMIDSHPFHESSLTILQSINQSDEEGYIAAHTLAELYAVLTRLPVRPRISSDIAWQLIQENVLSTLEVISLTKDDYVHVLRQLARLGITGGATYDALIAHTAMKGSVDQLVTLNERDFVRVYPDISEIVSAP